MLVIQIEFKQAQIVVYMQTKMSAKTAKRNFIKDIEKKFSDDHKISLRLEELGGQSQHMAEQDRKRAAQMETRTKKLYAKTIRLLNQSLEPSKAPIVTSLMDERKKKERAFRTHSSTSGHPPKVTTVSQRNLIKRRIEDLDHRIQKHFHHPSGPLSLVIGFQKLDASPKRITNKIQIEELIRLKKGNLESTYLDASLDFVKMRGSSYGLPLSKFVQEQLKYEEIITLKEEIAKGLKVMQILTKSPNEQIMQYWKDKLKHMKSIIKAQKYDIDIPEPLQFMNSDDEMMEEIHKKIAKDKEKEALRSLIPTANTQPKITTSSTQGNLQTLSAEEPDEQQPQKDQQSKFKKLVVSRPTTAQPKPLTKLYKATTISVHKHQWPQKGSRIVKSKNCATVDASADQVKPVNALLVSGVSKSIEKRKKIGEVSQIAEIGEGKLDSFTRNWLNIDLAESMAQNQIQKINDKQGVIEELQKEEMQPPSESKNVEENKLNDSIETILNKSYTLDEHAMEKITTLKAKQEQEKENNPIFPVSKFSGDEMYTNIVKDSSSIGSKNNEKIQSSTLLASPKNNSSRQSTIPTDLFQKKSMSTKQLQPCTVYDVLPLTSLHIMDEEVPYRSVSKFNPQKSNQQRSSIKSGRAFTNQYVNVGAPPKSVGSTGSRLSLRSFSKVNLRHDLIQIHSVQKSHQTLPVSKKQISSEKEHKRNTSSVDLSAGVKYFNRNQQAARGDYMFKNGQAIRKSVVKQKAKHRPATPIQMRMLAQDTPTKKLKRFRGQNINSKKQSRSKSKPKSPKAHLMAEIPKRSLNQHNYMMLDNQTDDSLVNIETLPLKNDAKMTSNKMQLSCIEQDEEGQQTLIAAKGIYSASIKLSVKQDAENSRLVSKGVKPIDGHDAPPPGANMMSIESSSTETLRQMGVKSFKKLQRPVSSIVRSDANMYHTIDANDLVGHSREFMIFQLKSGGASTVSSGLQDNLVKYRPNSSSFSSSKNQTDDLGIRVYSKAIVLNERDEPKKKLSVAQQLSSSDADYSSVTKKSQNQATRNTKVTQSQMRKQSSYMALKEDTTETQRKSQNGSSASYSDQVCDTIPIQKEEQAKEFGGNSLQKQQQPNFVQANSLIVKTKTPKQQIDDSFGDFLNIRPPSYTTLRVSRDRKMMAMYNSASIDKLKNFGHQHRDGSIVHHLEAHPDLRLKVTIIPSSLNMSQHGSRDASPITQNLGIATNHYIRPKQRALRQQKQIKKRIIAFHQSKRTEKNEQEDLVFNDTIKMVGSSPQTNSQSSELEEKEAKKMMQAYIRSSITGSRVQTKQKRQRKTAKLTQANEKTKQLQKYIDSRQSSLQDDEDLSNGYDDENLSRGKSHGSRLCQLSKY